MPAGTQQPGGEQPAQHAQQALTASQQAQQGLSCEAQQGAPPGGVLRKPKPVGIGHMCRAISTLTGGWLLLNFICSFWSAASAGLQKFGLSGAKAKLRHACSR